jgi:Skp family chaperone for outer membrane proteins
MQNPIQDKYRTCFVLALIVLLAACSSGDAQLEGELLSTKRRLQDLTSALEGGSLRNASIIKQYSSLLQRSRPELAPLLTQLEKEATTSNPVYQSLQQRYSAVRDETEHFDSWVEKVEELKLIQTAADTSSFNDSLSDTVNVIADLSNGELARVNAVAKGTEMTANKSQDFGAGSQYMGNPHYGHWSHGSGGSFWAWYGQYHFFSSMFGRNRYYYNDWAGHRGYSYYSDIGRNSYTSRSQRVGQRDVATRAKKQFGSRGNFKSPYSKARTGATGMSKASTAQQKSAFKSPYSRSTASTSKYQSSTRNSRFRTSRGTSRGK